ncbi:hypothetical protein GCM10027570_19220 [Streptomonospora sediminis]
MRAETRHGAVVQGGPAAWHVLPRRQRVIRQSLSSVRKCALWAILPVPSFGACPAPGAVRRAAGMRYSRFHAAELLALLWQPAYG